jgi:hypothetical protein
LRDHFILHDIPIFILEFTSVDRKHSGALDRAGRRIEVTQYQEKLVPSTRFVAVNGVGPSVSEKATFIAPSAAVIGDVTIGKATRYAAVLLYCLAKRGGGRRESWFLIF